jgi:hypothetical protein
MPSVAEVLKQSGFSDEQIKALDSKAITVFDSLVSDAERQRQEATQARQEAQSAKDAAELAQRSNVDFYENKIAPSLTAWEEEKAKIENSAARNAAEAAFYRTQAEEAKKAGFIATEAPSFDPTKFIPAQPRDTQGRYVPNVPGTTPGSPTFDVNQVYQRAGDAVGVIADLQWEHQRLFGQPMPISPTDLIRQADAVKLDPKAYAARTFNWDTRREQMRKEEEEKRAKEIATAAVAPYEAKLKEADEQRRKELAELDKKWAERVGSNPDVRSSQPSRFADINRAVKANEMPDPLTLNDTQRRQMTSQMIRKDIDQQQVQ